MTQPSLLRRFQRLPEGRRFALGALLLLLPLLLRLGAAPLFDVDEGAFSEATREMLANRDFGFTTLNGEPRFDKPILVYWFQALSVGVFGLNEFALRFTSAASAWLWALAVVRFARPRLGEGAAWLAGVFTVSSLGVLAIGRAATADGLLNLLLALATLEGWRVLEALQAGQSMAPGPGWRGTFGGARAPLMRLYLWVGLGLLTKGPIAVLVPGAATLLFALTSGQWAAWRRTAFDWRGWLLAALIALPWYGYALHRHGQAFIDGFFIQHNLARYGGTLEGHGGSVGYYVVLLPVLLLPWSGLLALVVARARTLWAEPLMRFCLLWVGFVVVFFSFSGTKLPHYVLYGATPCFLLAARCAAEAPAWARRTAVASVVLLLALAFALPGIVARATSPDTEPLYRTLLAPDTLPGAGALRGAAVLAALAFWAAWAVHGRFAVRLGWGCALGTLVVTTTLTPWLSQLLQAPVKLAGLTAGQTLRLPDFTHPEREGNTVSAGTPPLVQWGVRLPSFALYARHEAPLWPQEQPLQPGMLALTRIDRVQATAPGGPGVTQACHPRVPTAAGAWADGPAFACEVLVQQRGVALVRAPGASR